MTSRLAELLLILNLQVGFVLLRVVVGLPTIPDHFLYSNCQSTLDLILWK